MSWSRLALLMAALGVCPRVPAEPRPSGPPAIDLVWADPAGLLRYGLLPWGFKTAASEVSAIFQRAGVRVKWSRLSRARPRDAEDVAGSILVVLTPSTPQAWDLPRGTLGAVLGREGPLTCVYVFYPAVARTLGVKVRGSSRRFPAGVLNETARAVGRVAAHEVVHAVSPDLSHTEHGLMQAKLTRAHLRQPSLQLSEKAAVAFRSRLTLRFRREKLARRAK